MAGGGRSNEFNPETSDSTSLGKSKQRDQTEKVAKSMEEKESGGHGGEKISYGRKFAQTQEHYVARQMNRELEELAKEDGALEEEVEVKAPAAEAKTEKKPAEKKSTRSKMEELGRTAPIGAIPVSSEPPPREAFGEVMTDALRYGGMIRDGVRDIFTATVRLARLPIELATLAAHRLRPLKA